jgi:hypothetical protein
MNQLSSTGTVLIPSHATPVTGFKLYDGWMDRQTVFQGKEERRRSIVPISNWKLVSNK